jgi:hypothetical protein
LDSTLNLSFTRLTIVSDTQKSANQFNFHPRFNLITGNDNSIGKSTLAKLLFWTLGCEPDLDPTWMSLDVRSLVDFKIGNDPYQIGRYGNSMFIKRPNGISNKFEKISGAYSKAFAEIVEFKTLLPNRNTPTTLEPPPPAFYFLPFYIDQLRSWSQTWNGFNQLSQYANWQKTIIQYHTGYLLPDHFLLQAKIAEKEIEKKDVTQQVARIETTIEVVKEYLPTNTKVLALTNDEFDNFFNEVNIELKSLQTKQEEYLKKISDLNSEQIYLQSQLELVRIAFVELESDYKFSVEQIKGDSLICPICGTEHDNSLPNRASILSDKDEAKNQIESISQKLNRVDKQLSQSQDTLTEIHMQID